MSAIQPAEEKIVRNLQQAVERLHEDLARVELWAGALSTFNKPIPGYGHGQTRFDLPPARSKSVHRAAETQTPRKTPASKTGTSGRGDAASNARG